MSPANFISKLRSMDAEWQEASRMKVVESVPHADYVKSILDDFRIFLSNLDAVRLLTTDISQRYETMEEAFNAGKIRDGITIANDIRRIGSYIAVPANGSISCHIRVREMLQKTVDEFFYDLPPFLQAAIVAGATERLNDGWRSLGLLSWLTNRGHVVYGLAENGALFGRLADAVETEVAKDAPKNKTPAKLLGHLRLEQIREHYGAELNNQEIENLRGRLRTWQKTHEDEVLKGEKTDGSPRYAWPAEIIEKKVQQIRESRRR